MMEQKNINDLIEHGFLKVLGDLSTRELFTACTGECSRAEGVLWRLVSACQRICSQCWIGDYCI